MTNHRESLLNTNMMSCSLKSRFTRGFLRALVWINRSKGPYANNGYRRYRRVKLAAYASMALAVGARRAWSRATLWKIRRQKLFFKRSKNTIISQYPSRNGVIKKKKKKKKRKKIKRAKSKAKTDGEVVSGSHELKKLRELVPGGEDMESCCLLEETADYIKCLAIQVQVMKSIADFYCP